MAECVTALSLVRSWAREGWVHRGPVVAVARSTEHRGQYGRGLPASLAAVGSLIAYERAAQGESTRSV
jgi:hypothetical protein